MLIVLYALNALLMLGLPVAAGVFLARRFQVPARLWWLGAATFVLSQIGHIPFNLLVFSGNRLPLPEGPGRLPLLALGLGLSSGVFEETARYLAYRFWIKTARTWRQAVLFGAGHGGMEAILVGVLAGATVINLVVLTTVDPATLGLTAAQMAAAQTQLDAALNVPWYMALLGAAERVFAMIFHLSAAVLVLQVFRRRNGLWLVAAIAWHAALNALTVIVFDRAGAVWAEVALAALTPISLAIILALRDGQAPAETSAPPRAPLQPIALSPLTAPPPTAENLEETRYA